MKNLFKNPIHPTFIRWVALMTALCLMLAGCSGGAQKKETQVRSPEDAIAVLAGRAEDWGYQNALAELSLLTTSVSGGQTFYRFQQNYQGIPVYGRHVVYVTDEEGKCLTITQNILDIPGDLDMTPTASAEMVENYVKSCIYSQLGIQKVNEQVVVDLEQAKLCIYDTEESERQVCLAYQIEWGNYLFLADAHSGEILRYTPRLRGAAAPATLHSSGETFQALELSDEIYVLKDVEEEIYLFDADGRSYWNPAAGNFQYGGLAMVTSPDSVFGNENDLAASPETAEAVFRTLRGIRKFYHEEFGRENERSLMVVYNDSCGGNSEGAGGGVVSAAGYENLLPGLDAEAQERLLDVVTLGTQYSANIASHADIAAHEYTHAVSGGLVGWSVNDGETGAVAEALSDILGELIPACMTGEAPDWQIADRNLQAPASAGLPERVSDTYPMGGYEIYKRSTVISHTAYRMWNGMDGTEEKKIPTEQLAELWYKAMLLMPPDVSFADCRFIVLEAARLMGLTAAQTGCIKDAFQNAEIWGGYYAAHALIAPSFRVNAYDENYNPLSRYELTVEELHYSYEPVLPVQEVQSISVKGKDPYEMQLEQGIYRITLTPRGEETGYPYLVQVMECEYDVLGLYCDDRTMEQFVCTPYIDAVKDGAAHMQVVPNTQVDIYSLRPRTLLASLNTGEVGEEVTTRLTAGEYVLHVQAEDYRPYEKVFTVDPHCVSQHQIHMFAPIEPEEETEPYFVFPELVTLQADMDYGVYPFPKDFILEEFGYEGRDMYHVYDTDTYGYDEGSEQDTITSTSPYYWWWASFDPSVEAQINEYISLLSQEPYCLELIHTKDMGDEWVYVYRYTGKHQVYPLNISGFVPADAGEYHFAVDISKRSDFHGRISLEIAAGYGLEPITPEILEDIRCHIGYQRTSNASEQIDENASKESGECYFCHKTVYATAERPIYDQQIVYCDSCYEDMFDK